MGTMIQAQSQFAERARNVRRKELWSLVGELSQRVGREEAESLMRAICQARTGQTSTKGLRAGELRDISLELRRRISRLPDVPAQEAEAPMTRKQQRMIAWLFAQLGMDTALRRSGFCTRILGKARARTRGEASKLYQALDAMALKELVDWPTIQAHLLVCQAAAGALNDWELANVTDLAHKLDRGQRVTYWLVSTVEDIYDRLGGYRP